MSEQIEYDFTGFIRCECVRCGEFISHKRETVDNQEYKSLIYEGRFGRCPGCFKYIYKGINEEEEKQRKKRKVANKNDDSKDDDETLAHLNALFGI